MNMNPRLRAFTLIELLIVVAIIAILAAIAVPNFLEAQTRSKVSRVKTDMRTVATALEAYHVDNNAYPPSNERPGTFPGSPFHGIGGGNMAYAGRVTTPIAYITQVPDDVFHAGRADSLGYGWDKFEYWGPGAVNVLQIEARREFLGPNTQVVVWSFGPSRSSEGWVFSVNTIYDPSNGTISAGNIYRPVPGSPTALTQ